MTGVVQVSVSCGSWDEAHGLAATLVEERLAACAQVLGPMTSVYRWEGEVDQAEEWLVLVKTTETAAEAVTRRAVELHGYELPEIVVVPVVGGSPAYLEWVAGQVR